MTSDSRQFIESMLFIFKLDLIRMQLKQESLRIFFIFVRAILTIGILFKSNTSEEIAMLAFDDVKSRPLVSNKSHEVSIGEVLFWASVKQGQLKVNTIEPGFKEVPVLLNINQ